MGQLVRENTTEATRRPALNDVVGRSFVLAYQEDVALLHGVLERERLNPTILRAVYTKEEEGYARAIRTFMNHHKAWQRASREPGYTLICESDFVPCRNIGSLPVFWPQDSPKAWGYLYQGSPRLIALVGPEKYLQGHCSPLVAYIVNAEVARVLCDFHDDVMSGRDPRVYFPFDTILQWRAMGAACSAFMPAKHYGEHGGFANQEHRAFGLRRGGRHRADNLAGPLCFLPQYSRGSWFRYRVARSQERLLGLARLFTGRWVIETDVCRLTAADKVRMNLIGLLRLLT